MNVDVVVELVLYLHKQEEEVNKVNADQHQGETRLRDIQCQVNMDRYTGTLSVIHATVVEILPINSQIKKTKANNLEIIGVILIQN